MTVCPSVQTIKFNIMKFCVRLNTNFGYGKMRIQIQNILQFLYYVIINTHTCPTSFAKLSIRISAQQSALNNKNETHHLSHTL